MATDDEMLENESSARPVQLVGTHGLEDGIDWHVDLQATPTQRTELYVAFVNVFGSIL